MADGRKVGTSRFGRAAKLGGVAAGAAAREAGARARGGRGARSGELDLETARKLVKALSGMRGAAMKFGQTLSAVDMGLVPEEHREEFQQILAELQQGADTVPFKAIRKVVEQDLGEKLGAVFADFDETPLAAASIGQVHRATLPGGRDVAVKVQYPGITEAVRADMQNLGMMLKILDRVAPGIASKAVADELRDRIAEELDYELEASNQRSMARAYRGHPFVVVPDVVTDLCRERVIVSDFVDGARFGDWLVQASQEERDRAGEIMVRFYLNGPMRHRLLNGDPHPGNALMLPEGRVAFLDFGFFKRLGDQEVADQVGTLKALYERDADGLLRIVSRVGQFPYDPALAEPLMEHYDAFFGWAVLEEPASVGPERTGEMMARWSQMRRDGFDQIQIPADHLVLMRAVMLLIGILGQLRATNPWLDIARAWLLDEPEATDLGRLEAAHLDGRGQTLST